MSAPGKAVTTRGKVVSREAALSWRRQLTAPLIFTNGVFDLLHPGHVDYLDEARSLGGHLIVAVNTDRSARALGKGPARPILDQAARARVLAGLASVDRVVLFDEPTPLELIIALAPDVLVKGGDYTRDSIVGAEEVERRGGRVIVIPRTTGYSTTDLVERCRAT